MEQANMEHAEDHGLHMTPEQEYSSSKLGMWLFLGTEIMLFGGLFAAYAIFISFIFVGPDDSGDTCYYTSFSFLARRTAWTCSTKEMLTSSFFLILSLFKRESH